MARYGVVETTKITEPCFDFKAVNDIENGSVVKKGNIVTGEKAIYTAEVPMILWDIDSGDWKKNTPENIVDNVLSVVKDGDIIIFHDDNASTLEALTAILPILKQWGFCVLYVLDVILS